MGTENRKRLRGAVAFITLMGVVSLFSDMTHEGVRSVLGEYLNLAGASGAAIGFISGVGELCGYSLRLLSGVFADKTKKYWTLVITGYALQVLAIPALALCTTGLENYTVPLGLGKWITSVTMTVFYVLLYYVWRKRYEIKGKAGLTAAVYGLAAARVILCMMPQNQWLSASTPLSWGIYRNIPFALMGLLIIVLFYRSAGECNDSAFRWMWLTIVLSFGFYIPAVLWADTIPMIGMLMIPKT